MSKRTLNTDPEALRKELINLLENFEQKLLTNDLRGKVISLIPALKKFRDLGKSLIPEIHENGDAAKKRMLHYFKCYPRLIIKSEELMIIAGISEWARRIRELRNEDGWQIVTGITLKEMAIQGDAKFADGIINKLSKNNYMLLDEECDRDAAHRWHLANTIRREGISIKKRLLKFLVENVGRKVTADELRYVSRNATEWARRIRELRTEEGWPIVTKYSGRPDLPVGVYLLEKNRQSHIHDRKIDDTVRMEVLERDEYRCQKCGWNYNKWNQADPRHLELHHIKPHVEGGKNSADNLVTLCFRCHDQVHSELKKKNKDN
ncbi:MAG TPA: HNH endonuclease [bacterium]|nr:HNH endonuclease [bacterium]